MNIWSILCLIWTLVAYVVAKKIYQKHPKLWLSPAISVPVLTIILMTIFGISYQTYSEETRESRCLSCTPFNIDVRSLHPIVTVGGNDQNVA